MPMSPRLLRPRASGYVTAIVTSSSGQTTAVTGNVLDITLTSLLTTIAFTGLADGQQKRVIVRLRQDSESYRFVAWPGGITWEGGSAPTLQTTANGSDLVELVTTDGGFTWAGKVLESVAGTTPPFSPLSISGLQAWFDSSDTASLFTDSNGELAASGNDTAVGLWADKTLNGRDAKAASTGKRPLIKTNSLNGRQILSFDGVDDLLSFAYDAAAPFTVFSVSRLNNSTDDTGIFIGNLLNSGSVDGFAHGNTLANQTGLFSTARVGAVNTNTGTFSASTTWRPCFTFITSTQVKARFGRTDVASGTASYNSRDTSVTIGGARTADVPGFMRAQSHAEVMIFSKELSTGEISSLESYVSTKWGV